MQIVVANWENLGKHARAVRDAVFVEEQGVPVELEWDEHDSSSLHAVAYDASGAPLATARLLPDRHIGRMAVLREMRGQGIGSAILEALMDRARSIGMQELVLHAQVTAIPFYARFGFMVEGEVFFEAGIPHRFMRWRRS